MEQATDGKTRVGVDGSERKVQSGATLEFSVDAAALVGDKETVDVELIVNGYPVASQRIGTGGDQQSLRFVHQFAQSGWAAIRVFPHAHTNPIYVVVDDQPVRGSVDSARWCLAGVEQCWKSKQSTYAAEEQDDAVAAYEHARNVYQSLIAELE